MAKSIYQILVELNGVSEAKSGIEALGSAVGLTDAALGAFTLKISQAAASYNDALGDLKTVSDSSTGTVDDLNEKFGDLSVAMGGAISKSEAATASYDILSAGIKDQASLLKLLEEGQKAAIAGQTDLGTATDVTTSILNAYGDVLGENLTQTERIDKVLDGLLQTQLDGKTTLNELGSAYGDIAPIAAAAGISFEELNASISTLTARGVATSEAITTLKAAIDNIQVPSSSAADEAERLGIEFGVSALKSKGLVGVLEDISTSSKFTDESISRLFGSTEAQTAVLSLLNDELVTVNNNLNSQEEAAGAVQEAYDQVTEDNQLLEFQNTLKLLNNALIDLGQGALVSLKPVIQLIAELAELFNSLPQPLKEFVGGAIALNTTVGALDASLAIAASNTKAFNKALKPIVTTLIPQLLPALASLKKSIKLTGLALKTAGINSVAFKAGLAVTAKKLALLAGAFGAVAAVAGGATLLAYASGLRAVNNSLDDFEERVISLEKGLDNFTAKFIELNKQDVLTPEQKKQAEIYRRLAKEQVAVIDEEIARLKEQAGLSKAQKNRRDGQIQSLERSKNSLERQLTIYDENLKATKENTEATNENAQSKEDAAEAYENYSQAISKAVSNLERELQNNLNALSGSEEENLERGIELRKQSVEEQIRLLKDLANQSGTSAERRKELEIEIRQKEIELNNQRRDDQEKLDQLRFDRIEARLKTEENQLKASFNRQEITEREFIQKRLDLAKKSFDQRKAILNEQIDEAPAESAEQLQLIEERSKLEADYFAEVKSLREQDARAVKEAKDKEREEIEKLKEKERERYEERLEAIRITTELELNGLKQVENRLKLQGDIVKNNSQFLSGQAQILSDIKSNLNSDNTTLKQRAALIRLASELTGKELNAKNAERSIELALGQIQLQKIRLKQEELKIDRERLIIAGQIKAAELEGRKAELQAQLSDPDLDENKKRSIESQLKATDTQAELNQKSTNLALEANTQQQQLAGFEEAFARIMSDPNLSKGETVGDLKEDIKKQNEAANRSANASEKSAEENKKTTGVVRESFGGLKGKAQEQINVSDKIAEETAKASGAIGSIKGTFDGLNTSFGNIEKGNKAILDSNLRVETELTTIRRIVQQLPSIISRTAQRSSAD